MAAGEACRVRALGRRLRGSRPAGSRRSGLRGPVLLGRASSARGRTRPPRAALVGEGRSTAPKPGWASARVPPQRAAGRPATMEARAGAGPRRAGGVLGAAGPSSANRATRTPAAPWARFSAWLECVCVVTFDLELGQALEVSARGRAPLLPPRPRPVPSLVPAPGPVPAPSFPSPQPAASPPSRSAPSSPELRLALSPRLSPAPLLPPSPTPRTSLPLRLALALGPRPLAPRPAPPLHPLGPGLSLLGPVPSLDPLYAHF